MVADGLGRAPHGQSAYQGWAYLTAARHERAFPLTGLVLCQVERRLGASGSCLKRSACC